MPALTYTRQVFQNPRQLAWWQWGHVVGLWFGLAVAVATCVLAMAGIRCPALLLALAGHTAGDFPLQNWWMTTGKQKRQFLPSVCHALISGGLAGLPFGPAGCLASIVAHLIIDATNKFGLGNDGYAGPIADQLAHVAVILLLMMVLG
ncbi:MAG: DUF3307 domain-containing protein [Thermoflexales bacterium]|nr:DUF3307 domain-containing protein [Thermoflexales bacterium]